MTRKVSNNRVFLLFLKERKSEFEQLMNTTKEVKEFERFREGFIAYNECYQMYCALYGVK